MPFKEIIFELFTVNAHQILFPLLLRLTVPTLLIIAFDIFWSNLIDTVIEGLPSPSPSSFSPACLNNCSLCDSLEVGN